MANLKLSRLPDRNPIKVTFSASRGLKEALDAYADLYNRTYEVAEPVNELIPFMLESFLAADRAFIQSRRGEGR